MSMPSSERSVVRSWLTPRAGVEGVGVLEEPHLEVGREGRQGHRSARPDGSGHAGQHHPVRVDGSRTGPSVPGRIVGADQAERALAERDRGIELAVEGQRRGRRGAGRWRHRDPRQPPRRGPARRTAREMSTPTISMPRSRQGQRVAPRSAADVEHPVHRAPGRAASIRNSTSLRGAPGERVAEVGGPRWSASGSNQWSGASSVTAAGSDAAHPRRGDPLPVLAPLCRTCHRSTRTSARRTSRSGARRA